MLNNSLNELIEKYERYKRERFWARVFLFILFAGIVFYMFNYFKSAQMKHLNTEVNSSKKSTVYRQTTYVKEKNATESNLTKKKVSKVKMSEKEKVHLKRLLLEDKKRHTYGSSINLAQYYLSIKHYKEAIMWSVKASKLDNKSVEPWIVYAKSKHALGKDSMAIKALQIYLGQHTSDEARELLNELKK